MCSYLIIAYCLLEASLEVKRLLSSCKTPKISVPLCKMGSIERFCAVSC